ncbi:MAG: signal recognition particle receptor subunit alpha [Nitrososphaerales archaeon]
MLEKLKEGLQNAVNVILGASTVDADSVRLFAKEVQNALIRADVNVRLAIELGSKVERRGLDEVPPPGLSRKDQVIRILYDELSSAIGTEGSIDLPVTKLNTILLVGIQGSGKTTVAAKLGRYLMKRGYKPGLIAADTFRPGALTQLEMLGKTVGLLVYGNSKEKNPVEVSRKGKEFLESQGKNVIIFDTAGRHKEEKGLLDEMKELSSKIQPDLTILVLDGTIGQQCYAQAEAFHNATEVGGLIITKMDGAAKGGGALAATAATGAKVLLLGTGERIDDLEAFSPTRFVGRLLGMGDLKALLERAKDLEEEVDESKVKRIVSGKMTIDDLYFQLEQVNKMGTLKKVFEFIPGLSGAMKNEDVEQLEEKMKIWKYVINSMTKEEKENPEILNSSRIKRISQGSGTRDREVKEMISRYRQSKTVMKSSKGRMMKQLLRGIPKDALTEEEV